MIQSLEKCVQRKDVPVDVRELIKTEIENLKKVEKERDNREKLYRYIFTKMNDGIIITDEIGRIIDLNPEAVRIFGAEKELIMGKHFIKSGVFNSKDIPRLSVCFEELNRGKSKSIDISIKNRESQEITVECIGSPIKMGKTIQNLIIVKEIGPRKQLDIAVREKAIQYQELFEQSNDAIFLTRLNGEIFEVNYRAAKLLGFEKAELIRMHNRDIVVNYDPEISSQRNDWLLSGGIVAPYQKIFRQKNSIEIPVEVTITLIRDIEGNPQYVQSLVRDITERQQFEEELREAKEKYQMLVERLQEGVLLEDKNGIITFVNPRVTEMFGYLEEDLLGKHQNIIIPPEEYSIIMKETGKRPKGIGSTYESSLLTKNGARIPVLISANPLFTDNGVFQGVLSVFTDLSPVKESEAKYASILRVAPIGIGVVRNRVITLVSDTFLEMTGYSQDEMLGKNARMVYPSQEEYKRVGNEKYREIDQYGTGRIETQFKCKDGRIIDVDLRSTPLDPNDYSKGVTFTALDITERKKAEKAIQESEERYKQLSEVTLEGIVIHDKGVTVDVNPSFENLSGYRREELVGKNAIEIVVMPEYRSLAYEKIATQYHKPYEIMGQRKDGTIIPIEIEARESKIKGNVVRVVSVRDISERKKIEEEIRFKSLMLENATDAILVNDLEHNIVYANEAVHKILGYTREEIFAISLDDIAVDPPDVRANRADTVMKHGNLIFETSNYRKDGTIVPLEVHSRIIDIEGKKFIINVTRDITSRKKAEKLLQESEYKFRILAQDLQDLVSLASHDLKTPLRGIKFLADCIVTDYTEKLDKNGKELLTLLMRRVTRMYGLIEGILDYSTVSRSREEISKVPLYETLHEIIELLSPPNTIEIAVECELPTIWAERSQILQIFQNLLDNAVKFNDKPTGLIKVSCIDKGNYWQFSVADNGPGIPKKYFEKIFQMFQTLDVWDKHESTGIGLALVRKIVQRYEGEIWVESTLGEGSTFFFTLPKNPSS